VAIYLRILKANGQQPEERQRRELKEFLHRKGYEFDGKFLDYESVGKEKG
jgi:DNA invertase Pin-like site-specific DNA recombinase